MSRKCKSQSYPRNEFTVRPTRFVLPNLKDIFTETFSLYKRRNGGKKCLYISNCVNNYCGFYCKNNSFFSVVNLT